MTATTPARRLDYVRRNEDAIATVLKTPWPADADFRPFFRPDSKEKMHMSDPQPDPIRDNANAVTDLANQNRPADTLLDRPTDSVVELPSTVKVHERDLEGHTTFIRLGR